MYTTHTVTEKVVVVDWAGERFYDRLPEIILVPGDKVIVRVDKAPHGTAYTLIWVSTTGIFTITRLVRNGSVHHNHCSKSYHAKVVADMCPVI